MSDVTERATTMSPPVLTGVTDHGRVETGINGVHRIEVSNGGIYYVKPRRNSRTFCNELLAAEIGPICQVPMCEAALISLSEDFLDLTSDARADFRSGGLFFGTLQETTDSLTLDDPDPQRAAEKLHNRDRVYNIVVFDELVANNDRKGNLGNLLLVRIGDSEPAWEIRAIDHDSILTGPNWTVRDLLDNQDHPKVLVDNRLHEWLQDSDTLEHAAEVVASNGGRYMLTVNAVPTELLSHESTAVSDFLEHRAQKLPEWVRTWFPYVLQPEAEGDHYE